MRLQHSIPALLGSVALVTASMLAGNATTALAGSTPQSSPQSVVAAYLTASDTNMNPAATSVVPAASFFDEASSNLATVSPFLQARANVVKAWAGTNVTVTSVTNRVLFGSVTVSGNHATVDADDEIGFTYEYNSGPGAGVPNVAGFSNPHTVSLALANGTWQITSDVFDDSIMGPSPGYASGNASSSSLSEANVQPAKGISPDTCTNCQINYNRSAVASYQDTYCGNASGCGNNEDYNCYWGNFSNETYVGCTALNLGGDCANFASQAENSQGGIPQDAYWYSTYPSGGSASSDWDNAQDLMNYTTNSPYGPTYDHGTLEATLTCSSANSYCNDSTSESTARSDLTTGDFVTYNWSTGGWHVATVVGTDSAGNPVVDSHSTDLSIPANPARESG